MVLMGVDYGLKYIGVSIGDTITKKAKPLIGFSYKNEGWISPLREVVERWQPQKIVVGLPLNADGSDQPLTKKVLLFVDLLKDEFGLPVDCADERWSTVEAKANLHASNKSNKVVKSMVDAESAKLILEQWLLENA